VQPGISWRPRTFASNGKANLYADHRNEIGIQAATKRLKQKKNNDTTT
jgi:hypothetical protein